MYKAELLQNNHVFQFASQHGARTRDTLNSSSLNANHRRLVLCIRQNWNAILNLSNQCVVGYYGVFFSLFLNDFILF